MRGLAWFFQADSGTYDPLIQFRCAFVTTLRLEANITPDRLCLKAVRKYMYAFIDFDVNLIFLTDSTR